MPRLALQIPFMRTASAWLLLAGMLLNAAACSTLTSTPSVSVDANQRWVLLPIDNLSASPRADGQAQALIETRLRARGVRDVDTYRPGQPVNLRALLDTAGELDDALAWARQANYRYGVTGTINEWHYKSGTDREPVVGINLKLLDLDSGQVLWQASAARTGWGYANLPAVADTVIARLLEGVRLEGI